MGDDGIMKDIRYTVKNVVEQGTLHKNVSRGYLAAKRLLDIVIAFMAIVLFLPVYIAAAVAVKCDSAGPVFEQTDVWGLKGRIFKLYRFRSSVFLAGQRFKRFAHGREISCCIFKKADAPGETKVGRFLIKFGIVGLPRLFNVLKGDMSLVGPKALPVHETEKIKDWYNLRLSAKPGMVGTWQSGCSSMDEMIRTDLKYIRERSIVYDAKIMFRTAGIMIKRLRNPKS